MRSCFDNGAGWLGKDMFGGEVSAVVSVDWVGEAVDALKMKRPLDSFPQKL